MMYATSCSCETLVVIKMNEVSSNRIKFYEFLNGDIDKGQLENWVYETKQLEKEFPEDHYLDLISFSFKQGDLKAYVSSLVDKFFNWQEYEKWRTIKLLREILNDEIETVLATRQLRQLYLEQEERIKWPLISIRLGVGFESVLDECPVESEYGNWNKDALKLQLAPIARYKKEILETAKKELSKITNTKLKSIDMGQIVSNKHMHQLFWEKLRFPKFYGENWDALWDAITGLVEMPKKLELYNWNKFEKEFPDDAETLQTIVSDFNNENNGKEIEIKAGNSGYNDSLAIAKTIT
jgi:RNAse (barnase) inhibitor barstar